MILGNEECDDDNSNDDDGCSSGCDVEDGFTCTGEPSICQENSNSASLLQISSAALLSAALFVF